LIAAENRSNYAAQKPAANAAGRRPPFAVRQILVDLVRKPRDGQRLQPHASWPLHHGQEQPIAAEDHVLDARNSGDLEADRALKRAHVAGMHAQHLAGSKIFHNQLAAQLKPCNSLPGQALQQEPVAAKDARAQRLLKSNAD